MVLSQRLLSDLMEAPKPNIKFDSFSILRFRVILDTNFQADRPSFYKPLVRTYGNPKSMLPVKTYNIKCACNIGNRENLNDNDFSYEELVRVKNVRLNL